jgi:hypothetical protein
LSIFSIEVNYGFFKGVADGRGALSILKSFHREEGPVAVELEGGGHKTEKPLRFCRGFSVLLCVMFMRPE